MDNTTLGTLKTKIQELINEGHSVDEIFKAIDSIGENARLLEIANTEGWDYISENERLPIEFIREYKNKINWKLVSLHQSLSEDDIVEFADCVDWLSIFLKYNLSKETIYKYQDKIRSAVIDSLDASYDMLQDKESAGYEELKEYDENGNLIHFKYSDGHEEWNGYDNCIHFKNFEKWYDYDEDENGNCIHFKDSDGTEYWKEYLQFGKVQCLVYKDHTGYKSFTYFNDKSEKLAFFDNKGKSTIFNVDEFASFFYQVPITFTVK